MTTAARSRVVVVGGGTAGCMVVSHLANNTNAEILLVEPGGMSAHDDSSRFFDAVGDDSLVFESEGVVQARALGGGSAVNGMLLTGEEPEFARGLTRISTSDDVGPLGRFLLSIGGRYSRLWWNGGRWNPGRAVHHLQEEGRVQILRDTVNGLIRRDGGWLVGTTAAEIEADMVVVCAGAIASPQLLVRSQLMQEDPDAMRNHFAISFVIELREPSVAPFDTAVVMECASDEGEMFSLHAYERLSSQDSAHGLLSIAHMNPTGKGPDLDTMLRALKELIKVGKKLEDANEVLKVLVDSEGRSLADISSMSDLSQRNWLKKNVMSLSHPCCSCSNITDADGRVRGTHSLWVADASVLKEVPTCTPAAPVTMEALRIAHIIAKEIA